MPSQLLELEFTVTEAMRVNRRWMAKDPEWKGLCDGKLLILAPWCPGERGIENLSAVAKTPAGKIVPLKFDKITVNESGCVSLFFEGILTRTVPINSTVRFEKIPKPPDEEGQYIAQERLDVFEAERILPRLEMEGIRFQIDADVSSHPSGEGPLRDQRIGLYVHVDDIPAWEKFRSEYFTV
jgi:hypothetical protein